MRFLMSEQTAIFVFKLRENIALEGDLLLAKMELDSFFIDKVQDLIDIKNIIQNVPELSELEGFGRLEANVRQNGKQAYIASGLLSLLPHLIRRVSFIQRIYCVTQFSERAKDFLVDTVDKLGSIVTYRVVENRIIIQAVPHYALIELAKVVANHSKGVDDTKLNLETMLEALLDRTANKQAIKLTNIVLSARSTTAHLSHDIHYYKAKFFPRMVHSILNICLQQLGEGSHQVIDNFVGSGTTLLEASLLGISSIGIDIDPLSTMIAQAKLDAVNIDSKLLARESAYVVQAIENRIIEIRLGGRCEVAEMNIPFPDWLMKNRKMTLEIANELSREIHILQSAITICDQQLHKLLYVLMSDAISRKIRMRFMGTGVGRFSLTFAKKSLLKIFTESLQQYVKVAAMCEWLKQTIHLHFADAQVIAADTKHIPKDLGQFDILVTSPPYLPASSGRESYAKARALSLIALGLQTPKDLHDLIDNSIGSMNADGIDLSMLTSDERDLVEWLRADKLREIKAEPTARYFLDMRQAFAEMYRILRPGAKAVVISGKNSTFYQFKTRIALYVVDVAEILADEAQKVGFEVDALHDIQLDKSNMNARPRSLDNYYETLIMLRKPI
jgi:DNA modification methylase